VTPRRLLAVDLACLAGLALVSAVLRWWHLGTASLWWDEILHIGTAQLPSLVDVFQHARLGLPAGSGNAGAVPLDYLLLHLYLGWVPFPEPESLERYFRLPSFLYASLTPPLLYVFVRRHFGRTNAVLAATLLTLCLPHVLYAAEARFYSLLTLMTVLDLMAFGWVVTSRATSAWVVFTLVAVCYFLTGLFGLLVLAAEYAALTVTVLARWWHRRRRPDDWHRHEAWIVLASILVMTAVVAGYFLGLDPHPRRTPRARGLDPFRVTWQTLPYVFAGSRVLVGAAVAGAACLLVGWRRRGWSPALCIPLGVVAVGVVPAIVLIERWQHYYFHPRHALFAVPIVHVGAALALTAAGGWLRGTFGARGRTPLARVAAGGALLALVVALQGPLVRQYLEQPNGFLLRTKMLRDFKGLMRHLGRWLDEVPPPRRLFVLAERFGPGYTANPVLAKYVRWYGLDDRVVLRGTSSPTSTLHRLADECARHCVGRPGGVLQGRVGSVESLVMVPPDARRLMRVGPPIGHWPGWVGGVSVLTYEPLRPGPWARGAKVARFSGIVSWERRSADP